MKNIFDYLKNNLTFSQYEDLPKNIGISPNKWAMLQNGNRSWSKEEVIKLSDIIDISLYEIVLTYGVGADIFTLKDMNELLAKTGDKLGLIAHVA